MKFMKLGSKPDTLQANGKNTRYMASELTTDIIVHVGEVIFNLHKFPLLSKSSLLQKLVTSPSEETTDEVFIIDIPGGDVAFEVCAKFCYGITVTLSAHNVITIRCAAEYLGMHETVEKGNLVHKLDVFLSSSIFRSWKDSIIALQTTQYMLPWSEELKLVAHSIDAIAAKASVNPSRVSWSYSYNLKKVAGKNGNGPGMHDAGSCKLVPKDWWVEDLCELELNLYKQVIVGIKSKGKVPNQVIGEALEVYFQRKLPDYTESHFLSENLTEYCSTLDTILCLLPKERGSVSCSFLLKLLRVAILLGSEEATKRHLIQKIAQQLEEATVDDLLIRANNREAMMYDVAIVQETILEFLAQDQNPETEIEYLEGENTQKKSAGILTEATRLLVAKLTDEYLAEIAKDHNLFASQFIELAEVVSSIVRPSHDGLYQAIDTYIKEHPGISKSERKRLCRIMDCKKLSAEACTHAVQNDRLPLRVIVQVLFFEQVRAAASSGTTTPDLPNSIKDLNSSNSARTNTNADEDWDATVTAEELKALKNEVAALRLERGRREWVSRNNHGGTLGKMKGLVMSNSILSRPRPSRNGHGESSGSDSSETPNVDGIKSPPSSNRTSFS